MEQPPLSVASRPRVAVVHGTLRVPPTYFTLQHAEPLRDRFDFAFFALAADVEPAARVFPVTDSVGLRGWPFRRREVLIPLAMGRLAKAIRGYDPALVHQHFGTWSLPARKASHGVGRPLIATLHGSDVFTTSYVGRDPRYAWHRSNVVGIFRDAQRILCVSRFLADAAISAGAPARRVDIHYQGIDTDFLNPGDQTQEEGPPRVVFVGRLAPYKGVLDLVRASTLLRERGLTHELVLVGDGPLRPELQELSRAQPHVHLTGPVDRTGVRDQLRRAHVVVLPSTPREAAGLVLLEAQACGVPVVAYDGGGKPEMLEPDVTGLLATQGDPGDLATRVREILELTSPEHAAMARAAREFVVTQRSIAVSAQRLGEHYSALLT